MTKQVIEYALDKQEFPEQVHNLFFCAQFGPTLSIAALLEITFVSTTLYANSVFASPDENYDPSYLDVCVAPPPPDLNCDDVPYNDTTHMDSIEKEIV